MRPIHSRLYMLKSIECLWMEIIYIGLLSRSFPLRWVETNTGSKYDIKCNIAKIQDPTDIYRADRRGIKFNQGFTMNHNESGWSI